MNTQVLKAYDAMLDALRKSEYLGSIADQKQAEATEARRQSRVAFLELEATRAIFHDLMMHDAGVDAMSVARSA